MKTHIYAMTLLLALMLGACSKGGDTPQSKPEVVTPPSAANTYAITGISPKTGRPATRVTITGTGFGSDKAAVTVLIGNAQYQDIISVAPTAIIIETNRSTLSGKVDVIVKGNKVTSTDDYTALPPNLEVTGFDERGQLGSPLYISGDGFGRDTNKISVSFGGAPPVKANYISGSGLTIGAKVPRNAIAGKVTVTVDGVSVTSKQDFNFKMSMRDFTPKSVTVGDTIKITGVEFTNKDDMYVDLNTTTNTLEKPIKVTSTELWVIVPFNARTGTIRISAQIGTITSLSEAQLTFTPRVSFTDYRLPSSAKIGDIITINGDFSGADISTMRVSFGGSISVVPTSISGPNISVKIPSDAKTGKITISRTGYTSYSAPFTFTITP